MPRYSFAIYKPPAPGYPWLAVTLEAGRPRDTFGCPSEVAAERVLTSMKARWSGKDGHPPG